jgi:hypothetical protein
MRFYETCDGTQRKCHTKDNAARNAVARDTESNETYHAIGNAARNARCKMRMLRNVKVNQREYHYVIPQRFANRFRSDRKADPQRFCSDFAVIPQLSQSDGKVVLSDSAAIAKRWESSFEASVKR